MEKKSKKKIMRIEEVDKGIPIARTWYHTGGKRELSREKENWRRRRRRRRGRWWWWVGYAARSRL